MTTPLWLSTVKPPFAYLGWKKEQEEVPVGTVEDLFKILEELDREYSLQTPIGVYITCRDCATVLLVLGANRSFLHFFPKDYHGEGSLHSTDETLEQEKRETPFGYTIFSQAFEVPLRQTIPKAEALGAVREFVLSTEMPDSISWELD